MAVFLNAEIAMGIHFLKVKSSKIVLTCLTTRHDVRNLNSKDYYKQSTCHFTFKLRAEVEGKTLVHTGKEIRGPLPPSVLLLMDSVSDAL